MPRTSPSPARFVLGIALLATALAASAPPPAPPADPPIDAATRSRVLSGVREQLESGYVFPDVAKKMSAALSEREKRREYDAITGSRAFAEKLTADLRAVSHDRHLHVDFNVEPIPITTENREPGPEEKRREAAFLQKVNHGFERVERLPGNIGYLDLRMFAPPDLAGETAAAAMTFLAGTDALIVDLRRNGGGEPEMVALLTSYLFGPKPVHLNDLYWRDGDRTQQFWTSGWVPGRRFGPDKPVWVLTSGDTFSGAEEFAYNLKNLGRATLVGETTGGGAHPGDFRRIDEHFQVWVPSGRAINPISKTNWEGTGVTPDVATPAESALDRAQQLALEKIIAAEGDPQRRGALEKALAKVKGRLDDAAAKPKG